MKRKAFLVIVTMVFIIGMLNVIPVKAATVSLNTSKKTVYAGSFFQLKLKNANDSVEWKSSKESVAQVLPSGIVVALKKGKATITATYQGVAYGCTVTVKNPTIDKTKANMRVDDELRLKMKGNNPVSWSSSNKKVATVDDGGLVKAHMVGTTTITAKCEDGNEYTSKVTVQNYDIKVGDIVKMGYYEQDANPQNGTELIEWEVLEVKDGRAVLISKYALDAKAFNNENVDRKWEDCFIREWLNNDFYNEVFKDEEKAKICKSVVSADRNSKYTNISQGNATEDDVYLLSINEYLTYRPSKCLPTEYATNKAVGGAVGENGYIKYWLRTKGESYWGDTITFVNYDETVDYSGGYYYLTYGIRPVICIFVDDN